VLLTLSSNVKIKQRKKSFTNKKANCYLFRSNLDEIVTLSVRLRTPIEIDSAIELTNNIIKVAKKAIPEIPARSNHEITYPMEIRELIKKKRKARKKMAPYERSIG